MPNMPGLETVKPPPETFFTTRHVWMVEGESFIPGQYGNWPPYVNWTYTADELATAHASLPPAMLHTANRNEKAVTGHHIIAMLNVWNNNYTKFPARAFTTECEADDFLMVHKFSDVRFTARGNLLVSFEQYYHDLSGISPYPAFELVDDVPLDQDWLELHIPTWRACIESALTLQATPDEAMAALLRTGIAVAQGTAAPSTGQLPETLYGPAP